MGYILGIIFILLVYGNDSAGAATATNPLTITAIMEALDVHAQVLMQGDAYNYIKALKYVNVFDIEHKIRLFEALKQINALPPKYQEFLIKLLTSINTNDILKENEAITNATATIDEAISTFAKQKEIIDAQVENITKIPRSLPHTGVMAYSSTIVATTIVIGLIAISLISQ